METDCDYSRPNDIANDIPAKSAIKIPYGFTVADSVWIKSSMQPIKIKKVEYHHLFTGLFFTINHSNTPEKIGVLPMAITVLMVVKTAEKNKG